ncbi:MAG: HD domain-containing protein [Burkholderiaceae bacterium]
MKPLFEQWRATWRNLGVAESDPVLYQTLIDHYSESHRKYHTLQHLEECFEKLSELRPLATHAEEIELALWFHDAIYSTIRHDNEERSADWAKSSVLEANVPVEVANRIHSLIMATRHRAIPSDNDAAILVDVDLSILGAPTARFNEYEKQVRAEYAHIPLFIFTSKRKGILQEFLDRPRIFTTQLFYERYEQQARENIRLSLAAVQG